MISVEELSQSQIDEVLERMNYGHLACVRDDRPYVVPVNYAFSDGNLFVYTTEGKKYEIIRVNPNVCLQVEDVKDNQTWHSVIVEGMAKQITAEPERKKALDLLVAINPTLTPAISIRWMDGWVRENIEVIYLIRPTVSSGRRSRKVSA